MYLLKYFLLEYFLKIKLLKYFLKIKLLFFLYLLTGCLHEVTCWHLDFFPN